MPERTEVFIKITNEPNTVSLDSDLMTSIQRFICMLYSKTGDVHLVNDARKILFIQSLRSLENVLPTLNALFQKVKRTILVATFMWNQRLVRSQNLPSSALGVGVEFRTRSRIHTRTHYHKRTHTRMRTHA